MFCINMFKFSTSPHIWHPLVLVSTLVILSCVRKAPCVGEWSARSSTEANLEMRGHGQLSPFSKQQTTCLRPDLCVCPRGSTSTLDKNLLHVLCLDQRRCRTFCVVKRCFVFPILTHSDMDVN